MFGEAHHIIEVAGGAIAIVPVAEVEQDDFGIVALERGYEIDGRREGGLGDDQIELVRFGNQLIDDVSGVRVGGEEGEAQHRIRIERIGLELGI